MAKQNLLGQQHYHSTACVYGILDVGEDGRTCDKIAAVDAELESMLRLQIWS